MRCEVYGKDVESCPYSKCRFAMKCKLENNYIYLLWLALFATGIFLLIYHDEVRLLPISIFTAHAQEQPSQITDMQPANHLAYTDLQRVDDGILIHGKYLAREHGVGDSMKPTIRNDSWEIVNTKVSRDEIAIGDIVVYWDGENNIEHRVIWRNETHFIARGDNNRWNDSIQPLANITGITVGIIY